MIFRFDYLEELLRIMDREQIRSTHDMLKSLFDGTALQKKQQPLIVDKNYIKVTKEEWDMEEGKGTSCFCSSIRNVFFRNIKPL